MSLTVLTQPVNSPVTLGEAKAHCRVDHSADDAVIQGLVDAAVEFVGRIIRKPLIYTTYRYIIDTFPFGPLEFPRQPVPQITAGGVYVYDMPRITYYDTGGSLQTLVLGTQYELDLNYNPPRLLLPPSRYWPLTQPAKRNAVTVDFVAGFGDNAAAVPRPLRLAVLMLTAHWYERREAVSSDAGSQVPMAVDSILRLYGAGDYQFHQVGGYQ